MLLLSKMKGLEELKKLNFPIDQFAIFGSGPLGIRRIRDSNDIDLIVKDNLWEELLKKYKTIKKKHNAIIIGNIEIFNNWPPFEDINLLIDSADIIEEFKFVKLEYVLEWKKFLGREKDLIDIKLIENYLM